MNQEKLLISIVMPSFNQARFIESSINSVLSQEYGNVELVIQDGGSSDGTLEILQDCAARDKRIRWKSAQDSGPAQAVNRALERSRGTLIGWLNSDDLYTPGAFNRAIEAMTGKPETIMVYGHGEHVDENGEFLSAYPTRKPEQGMEMFRAGCPICQPTVLFKRSLYSLLGPLEETYKTSFDYEYWTRAFTKMPDRIGFVDAVQAQSRLHADCITQNQRQTVALEGARIGRLFLGGAEQHWISTHLEEMAKEIGCEENQEVFLAEANKFLDQAEVDFQPGELDEIRHQLADTLT